MSDIYELLSAPFDPMDVAWRVGSTNKDKTKGMALAYVDARVVMDRLDAVCGPAGWQNRYPHAEGKKTVCDIGIKDPASGEWIWKSDGAGDSDFEADKGALSDAFKRAAVRWGIGRYLYEVAAPWVAIEAFGKSFVIQDSEKAKLTALLRKSAPPPVQTNGTLSPEDKARKWATDEAPKELSAIKAQTQLSAWLKENQKKTSFVAKIDPVIGGLLQKAISASADRINPLAAG